LRDVIALCWYVLWLQEGGQVRLAGSASMDALPTNLPCSITTVHLNALYSIVCVAKSILIISSYKQLHLMSQVINNPHCIKPWTKICIMLYEWNGHLQDPKQQIKPVLLHQLFQMTCVIVYP